MLRKNHSETPKVNRSFQFYIVWTHRLGDDDLAQAKGEPKALGGANGLSQSLETLSGMLTRGSCLGSAAE